MEKTVLLREVFPKRELQLDLTRLDADEPSAYRVHRALSVEAGANSRLVRLVTRFEFLGGHSETGETVMIGVLLAFSSSVAVARKYMVWFYPSQRAG